MSQHDFASGLDAIEIGSPGDGDDFDFLRAQGADHSHAEDRGAALRSMLLDLAGSDLNYSDIHIQQDERVMIRMPMGQVAAPNVAPATREEIEGFLGDIDEDWRAEISHRAFSRSIDLVSCRLRINAYYINSGSAISINVRRQPLLPVPFGSTGLPQFLRPLLEKPQGLILFTGQTGAGKTTSMASMIDHINETRAAHIITIEDPIEFMHERKKSIISAKEVLVDTPSFAQGLRDSLRQKPDVIMVGEIRDKETAETLFLAGESGHLVLASLHTNSARGALNKLLSWFPDETEHRARAIADTLLAVISQTLVPSIDGNERVLATEVLMNHAPEMERLLEKPGAYAEIQKFMAEENDNMSHTLNSSLAKLVRDKQITPEQASRHTNDRLDLVGRLRDGNAR